MKHLILLVIFINFLFSSEINFTEEEKTYIKNHKSVKLGLMNNYAPFTYLKDGELIGFTHDLVDLISDKSGLKFEKINSNWSDTYKRFTNEEIDIIAELSYTDKRAKFISFTSSYYEIPVAVFAKKDFGEYTGLSSLSGKRVGILKGSYLIDELKKIPNVKVLEVSSSHDKLLAIKNNKIDALLSNELSLYRTDSFLLNDLEIKGYFGFDEIVKEDFRFGVLKENSILSDIINKTLKSIPYSSISKLKEKWIFTNFKEPNSLLSDKENNWVKSNVIKVGVEDAKPYIFFNKNKNDIDGLYADILKNILYSTDLRVEYVQDSWKNLLESFRNKEIDLLPATFYSKERESFGNFSDEYYSVREFIYTKADSKVSYDDLNNKRIAIVESYSTIKKIKDKFPDVDIVETKSLQHSIDLVLNNEVDALIDYHLVVENFISENDIVGLKIVSQDYFDSFSVHNFSNIDKPILNTIIQKGLKNISEEERNKIYKKWFSNVYSELNIDLFSDEEKMYLKNNPIIKVQGIEGFAPFNFYDGEKTVGYSVDYFNLLSKYLDVKFEFVNSKTFSETMKMFRDGKIDILPSIARNKQREKFIEYTDFNHLDYLVGATLREEENTTDFEKLKDKTIAVIDKTFIHTYIKKNYPEQKLFYVKNTNDGVLAVSNSKADVFIGSVPTMDFFIKRNWINNVKTLQLDNIKLPKTVSLPMGLQKDNKVLKSILEKVNSYINYTDIIELQEKWIFTKNISNMSLGLTQKEKTYLRQKDKIKICVLPNWLPFEQIDDKKNHKGIGRDILDVVSKKIDKEFILVPTTKWADSLQNIRDRKCDVLPVAMNIPSRRDAMNFTEPYVKEPFVIATTNDKFFIRDINDLSNKKIGIVKSYATIEVLKEKNPLIEVVEVNNTKEGLEKVSSGEIYGYVDIMPTTGYFIQKHGFFDLKIAGKLSSTINLSIASRNDEPLLNSIMQKALNTISEDEIRKIVGRWIEIKVQQEFDYRNLFYVIGFFTFIVLLIIYRGKKINEQKNEFKKLIENSTDGLFIVDLESNLVECSNKACEMLGYTKSEMLKLRVKDWEYIHTEEEIQKNIKSLTNKTKKIVSKYKRKDGSLFDAEIYINKINFANKELVYTSVRDVTKEKELQKKIIEQKTELESIFDYSKDGIAVIDLETKFLKVNRAYIELTGFTEEELLGTSCLALTASEDLEKTKQAMEVALEQGYLTNLEKTCVVKDNKRVQVNISVSMLPDKKSFIMLSKDMTELKNMESQARLASMGQMVGNISHQWRQPLSVMTTYASGIKIKMELDDELDKNMVNDCLDVVIEQSNYLSTTIENFRDFIKNDKQFKTISLKSAVESSISLTKASLDNNYITLESNIDSDVTIFGNANELIEALINVLNNAKDVLKSNVKSENDRYVFVSINECTDKEHIEVLIKDTGGGIKDDIIDKIFDPYFTTKHQTQGTGLGLSIVDRIIRERHNGLINVYNETFTHNNKEYQGACFSIKFEISKNNI